MTIQSHARFHGYARLDHNRNSEADSNAILADAPARISNYEEVQLIKVDLTNWHFNWERGAR